MTASRWTDVAYLHYQYADSERLRIRADTHRLYTVWSNGQASDDPFVDGLRAAMRLAAGMRLLDVGCGPASFPQFEGATRIGVDLSLGMLNEARAHGCRCAQADAQVLPFKDACVERVMANHMLFYVPDRERALREMRRVLRPGGRLVLTTNGSHFLPRLAALHEQAARDLGFTPEAGALPRFTLDDLDLVHSVFANARRNVLEGALVFPDAEAVLRYYASGPIDRIADPPPDGSHRLALLKRIGESTQAIVDAERTFTDPKSVGWFTADV